LLVAGLNHDTVVQVGFWLFWVCFFLSKERKIKYGRVDHQEKNGKKGSHTRQIVKKHFGGRVICLGIWMNVRIY